jgi:lincosamide nucleotidyltransferase A/C/D/E
VPRSGRGRQPQAETDAARVLDLLAHLKTRSIEVWLDGGWAVDALLGEQTRAHDDLDVVARLDDGARIEQALRERGYALAGGGAPSSFELVDQEGHQVDVHPVSFTPTGEGVYRMANGEDWIYGADSFGGVGRILGHEVPCLAPEAVMVSHTTGYALDEAHQRDVRALGERYGIPIPDFELARRSS